MVSAQLVLTDRDAVITLPVVVPLVYISLAL
jgi:hypothetical protein